MAVLRGGLRVTRSAWGVRCGIDGCGLVKVARSGDRPQRVGLLNRNTSPQLGGVSELNQFVHGNELITFPLHDDLRNRVSSRYISHLHRDLAEGSLSIQSASDWYQQSTRKFTPLLWGKAFTGAEILSDGGFGFIFDASWQFAQDLDNPYLSLTDKIERGIIAGGVGFVAGVTVVALVGTGPVGFIGAVVVGWFVETPITNLIFEYTGLTPERDIAPLISN